MSARQMALEALKRVTSVLCDELEFFPETNAVCIEAIAVIEADMAKVVEPYAWVYHNKYGFDSVPASKEWCEAMLSHGGAMFPLFIASHQPTVPDEIDYKSAWRGASFQIDAIAKERDELLAALVPLVEIIDKAGLSNLANGVQLGQTSWYVKASDRLDIARAAIAKAVQA